MASRTGLFGRPCVDAITETSAGYHATVPRWRTGARRVAACGRTRRMSRPRRSGSPGTARTPLRTTSTSPRRRRVALRGPGARRRARGRGRRRCAHSVALPTSSKTRARRRRGCARANRPADGDRHGGGYRGDGRDRPARSGPAPAAARRRFPDPHGCRYFRALRARHDGRAEPAAPGPLPRLRGHVRDHMTTNRQTVTRLGASYSVVGGGPGASVAL